MAELLKMRGYQGLYDKKNKCVYDFSTRNRSFVQLAKDLHTIGIKNYYFPLKLLDVTLQGVDPYDKNLTKDQIDRIIIECASNPWYFLREVVRIPEEGGDDRGVSYRANRGNIAQAWCVIHGIDSYLCLPRQQGKTVSMLCLLAWMFIIGTSNSKFIFVNKDGPNAKNNLKILSNIVHLLPVYLRSEDIRDDETGKNIRGKDNATEKYNPNINNTILTRAQASSREKAISLGRGLTAPIIHYDEPAFTNYIKEIVANSASTQDTAAANAKKNGGMYARIFTCTPGDLDTAPGRDEQWILDRTARWTDSFYDLGPEAILKQYDQVNECNRIVYIEFSYKQIGKDDKWLHEMSAKIGDKITIRRELLLQRIHGSSLSPFDQEDIQAINDLKQDPIKELWIGDWMFDIYEELDSRISYLVGVDCATGTMGDNNAITVINPYTTKPVAEFKSKYIGEPEYVKLITDLVLHFIPRACVCIEKNHVGSAIIAFLMKTPISHRIYFDKNEDLIEENLDRYEKRESMLKKTAIFKRSLGVATTPKSRAQMFDVLSNRIADHKDKFITRNIIKDIGNLIRTKTGKVEAAPGEHDDSIMSYLIAMYVYTHGSNLEAFGIKRKLIMGDDNSILDVAVPDQTINRDLISDEAAQNITQMRAAIANDAKNNYDNQIKKAVIEAQRRSRLLKERLGVKGSVFDNTDDKEIYGEYYDPMASQVDDDFFNEINGFDYDEPTPQTPFQNTGFSNPGENGYFPTGYDIFDF